MDMNQCIQDCIRCHQVCIETINHCLQEGGKHAAPEHIQTLADCVDICQTSTNFMLRNSDLHVQTCGVCAEVCEACASSCEQVGDDPAMKRCAEECRRCADSCRQMSGSQPGSRAA